LKACAAIVSASLDACEHDALMSRALPAPSSGRSAVRHSASDVTARCVAASKEKSCVAGAPAPARCLAGAHTCRFSGWPTDAVGA